MILLAQKMTFLFGLAGRESHIAKSIAFPSQNKNTPSGVFLFAYARVTPTAFGPLSDCMVEKVTF